MSRLSDIQAAFQRLLLRGDSTIESHVVGTQRVPVERRLGIYAEGYRLRLIEALQKTFPVLAELMGEADFQTLAARYVEAHESTFFNIRWYGGQMGEFLAADSQYLAEIARWEWAMAAAFDAADAQALGPDQFARIAPEDWAGLRFEWAPAVQVVPLEWNIPQLWKAVSEGSEERPEPVYEPGRYLIWRRELQIYFRRVGAEEASAMAAAREGRSFGELCVLLCEHFDESEAPRYAAGYLRGWVEAGLLVGLVSSATED